MSRQQAYEDYKAGMKPKEIAEKYGVPANTVKSWLKRSKKEDVARAQGAEGAPRETHPAPQSAPPEKQHPKGGAPYGNQNARGNRGGTAPARNTNAKKDGAFSKIYLDALDEEEQALCDLLEPDEESILVLQLKELTIKARRLRHRIRDLEKAHTGLAIDSMTKSNNANQGETVTSVARPIIERILRIDAEYDRTQGRITKITQMLMRHRESQERLRIERQRMKLYRLKLLGVLDVEDLDGVESAGIDDILDVEGPEKI